MACSWKASASRSTGQKRVISARKCRVCHSASGEPQEKTTWFRVTCWRKLAETAGQYVKKGMRILVEGEVEAQAYVDRDGTARGTLELTATTFKFLSSRAEAGEGAAIESGATEELPVHEDEIPF